jgi:ArsR family transcriptional regulator
MRRTSRTKLVADYARLFSALGAEARLRVVRLLLSGHPQGMVVGDIAAELGIPNSTLSHHLEKLKNLNLVKVRREGTFLWYTANDELLQELQAFLYEECCTRGRNTPLRSVQPAEKE